MFHVDTCITEITDAPSGLNHLTAHVERSQEREEMKWKLTISLIDIYSSGEEQTEDGKTNRFSWMEDKKKQNSPITRCPAVLTSLLAIQRHI